MSRMLMVLLLLISVPASSQILQIQQSENPFGSFRGPSFAEFDKHKFTLGAIAGQHYRSGILVRARLSQEASLRASIFYYVEENDIQGRLSPSELSELWGSADFQFNFATHSLASTPVRYYGLAGVSFFSRRTRDEEAINAFDRSLSRASTVLFLGLGGEWLLANHISVFAEVTTAPQFYDNGVLINDIPGDGQFSEVFQGIAVGINIAL